MSKAMRKLNKYEYKELLLSGNPIWENFYKDELIGFLEIAKELLEDHKATKVAHYEAIEFIKNYDVFKEFTFPLMKRDEENQVKSSIDYQFKNNLKKNLLQILGDKENE